MVCSACGSENREGRSFCSRCGAALARACAACGAANEPEDAFCGRCGGPLEAAAEPQAPPARESGAERRFVSILFADLVGFTPLSESRDPEDVRELLSRYFETCRRLIELYGGTVEKFIGDAVMAVWGTPVAQEDDAERAVRTALDLVAAVSALGDEVGAPELRARAGVLSGEAAVTLGARGEGMVAGDLVNTAARIQASAEPGTVLVGETTRRASEAAIAYEDAGAHPLKGKSEPVPLHRAVRVTAARGGALRSTGLEAPFVGRERELRLVKELFHAVAEQRRSHLVSIVGIAGIGKSRLAWEFFKYLDGLADEVWWHRGRCLAYGEGVAYWALAEMVRMRAGILEGEDPATARTKLAERLAEHVPDPEERAWIEPRLANLLGLEERVDADRQDLFAAWRVFFERLADRNPVVLVFEDLQWADAALLAFVEYLLAWSGGLRLYVLALARPELAAQSPEFGRSVRNATTLALEPLSDESMAELLEGYVPGVPAELKQQVLERAQGVPLYAVETVRMLLDRGLLVEEGSVYRPTGSFETLEVPETLHALAAARLDGLEPAERQLVQDACVLGKTFTQAALSRLADTPEQELEPLLGALVRKQVLSLQADARFPERGQYGFLQELLRQVAYETLSRRDRKRRHLAAVDALEASFHGLDQEVPEVVATHLLAAFDAGRDDPDAPAIRTRAREALVQAAERAAALAAPEEGQRYLEQAAALAGEEPLVEAELLLQAGRLAVRAGRPADARERMERAVALNRASGDTHREARAVAALANVDLLDGMLEQARARLEPVLPVLEAAGPSEELALTLAQLGRMQALLGEPGPAAATLERALRLAELLSLDDVLVQALTSKGVVLLNEGRHLEARIILEGAMAQARANELHIAWYRAANNLGVLLQDSDRHAEALELGEELEAVASQRGDRDLAAGNRIGSIPQLALLGRWQEVLERAAETAELEASAWAHFEVIEAAPVFCERGELGPADGLLKEYALLRDGDQVEMRISFASVEARVFRAHGRPGEALAAAERGLGAGMSVTSLRVKRCYVEALEAALALGDLARADELVAEIEALRPGEATPYLRAHGARFRARIDAERGSGERVDASFRSAEAGLREFGFVFDLAVTQLEHAEWLEGQGRAQEAEPLRDEARATFERLEARPWLERLHAAPAGVDPGARV